MLRRTEPPQLLGNICTFTQDVSTHTQRGPGTTSRLLACSDTSLFAVIFCHPGFQRSLTPFPLSGLTWAFLSTRLSHQPGVSTQVLQRWLDAPDPVTGHYSIPVQSHSGPACQSLPGVWDHSELSHNSLFPLSRSSLIRRPYSFYAPRFSVGFRTRQRYALVWHGGKGSSVLELASPLGLAPLDLAVLHAVYPTTNQAYLGRFQSQRSLSGHPLGPTRDMLYAIRNVGEDRSYLLSATAIKRTATNNNRLQHPTDDPNRWESLLILLFIPPGDARTLELLPSRRSRRQKASWKAGFKLPVPGSLVPVP